MLARPILCAFALTLTFALVPTAAQAATTSIEVSADPAEDLPVTVTVSGAADSATSLYVFRHVGTSACASTASGNAYIDELSGSLGYMTDGDAIPAGAYSRAHAFTPDETGSSRICAYLASSAFATPQATATAVVTARATIASLNISTSADPSEEETYSYTVTGATEVDRSLYVFVAQGSSPCPGTPGDNSYNNELSGSLGYMTDGDVVAAGAFSRTYQHVPSDSGSYRVCAYVDESPYDVPNATETALTTVREPEASLGLAVSDDPAEEQQLTVTATGTTEVDRTLYVFVAQGSSPCSSTPGGNAYIDELSGSLGYMTDGTAVLAGAFTKSFVFTPPDAGAYRLCAYVDESTFDGPNAVATTTISARAPHADLTASISPADYDGGETMTVTVAARPEVDRRLYVFRTSTADGCAATPSGNSQVGELTGSVGYMTDGDTFGAGQAVTKTYTFTASAGDAAYRICAYVAESVANMPDAAASALSSRRSHHVDLPGRLPLTIKPDPAYAVGAVTKDGDEQRDRLLLRWRKGPAGADDRLYVYDEPPAAGVASVWNAEVDDPESTKVDLKDRDDIRHARVRQFLGYGRFWWRVARTDRQGNRVFSDVHWVKVVPRPLRPAAVTVKDKLTLRSSSKRPGTARLVVRSSPLAKVKVVVRHGGRTIARRSYTEGVGGVRGLSFALTCARTGSFSYTVTITDPYGASVTRRGSWTSSASRCARLRAAERARADVKRRAAQRRREAERRRQQEASQDDSSGSGDVDGSGGGGGCDGDPHATPYPQFAGQRDGDHDGCYGET